MGCYNSAVINAPIETVWAKIRDFHDMAWAAGVIESTEVVGDKKGDQIGAKRKLNGVFAETLLSLDDVAHVIKYSIDAGPPPLDTVKNYVGEVRAFSVTDSGQTFIEWTSEWTEESGGVKDFCDPVYQGLLKSMQDRIS